MASVSSPKITYIPNLPDKLITEGKLSGAQLENICLAGQAHEVLLPDGKRKGFFIGDGTGVGKGRQAAAIILDNWNNGRKKAVWVSANKDLSTDAKRDFKALGGDPEKIIKWNDKRKKISSMDEGVIFVAYSTLGSGDTVKELGGITNAEAIKKWLGDDFDGCIIFDEAHNMNNLISTKGKHGNTTPAKSAVNCDKFQDALPKARVTYLSATGATDVRELAFASRLGLWGEGTAFKDVKAFIEGISSAGVSAMELTARDMKAMGVYNARSLSYEGVKYDTLTHNLTPSQRNMYDTVCDAWQLALSRTYEAAKLTKGKANLSAFYGSLQRCYNQVLSSFATPAVIEDIHAELDNGHSCVIQLVNTEEAEQKRKTGEAKEKGLDLEEIDLSPKDTLIQYVQKCFPIEMYEDVLDEKGNIKQEKVKDANGNPVISREAQRIQAQLIEELNDISLPESPIDMILNEFGVDKVAEVTGRSSRIVYVTGEDGNRKKVEQKITPSMKDAETGLFQGGEKRVLIFSKAGATGRSFHADRAAKNQEQRIHYILQPGFNAKEITQGFGRTHRTNSVSQPVYKLVQTDVLGQKRFVTSIARRLDQLGALTKGQRETGSGIFGEKDNLESPVSREALREWYNRLLKGQIPGLDAEGVLSRMGTLNKFKDGKSGQLKMDEDAGRDMITFLNRLLALRIDEQNAVYSSFEVIREAFYDEAIESGSLDRGLEYVKSDKAEVIQREVIHEQDGAKTEYIRLKIYNRAKITETVEDAMAKFNNFQKIVKTEDGSVFAVYRVADSTDKSGRVHKKYRLQGPNSGVTRWYIDDTLSSRTKDIPRSDWDKEWNRAVSEVPEYNESEMSMVTGTLLPIWDSIKGSAQSTSIKAKKVTTEDGYTFLGMILGKDTADAFLRKFDKKSTSGLENLTAENVYDAVMKDNKEAKLRRTDGHVIALRRSRVSGENRIEVVTTSKGDYGDMIYYYGSGLIKETIEYKPRLFIPTSARGVETIGQLMAKMKLVSVGVEQDSFALKRGYETRHASGDVSAAELFGWSGSQGGIKSKHDIVAEAEKLFGVKIVQGKTRGDLGRYGVHSGVIRLANYNDIETVSHEIGHMLDNKYMLSEFDNIEEIVSAYVNVISSQGYNEEEFAHEAVGNFMHDYVISTDKTRTAYPEFTKEFENRIEKSDFRKLRQFSKDVRDYLSASEDERAQAAISRRSDKSRASYKVRKAIDKVTDVRGNAKLFEFAIYDDLTYLKGMNETYDTAMYNRVATTKAANMVRYGIRDRNGNKISKGLPEILRDHGISESAEKVALFEEYLIAGCALDLYDDTDAWNAENPGEKREVPVTYPDADMNDRDKIEARYRRRGWENPGFSEAAEEIYQFIRAYNSLAVDSGLISQETMEMLHKRYPRYVPFARNMEDKDARGNGNSTKGKLIKKRKGSVRNIYSPIENILMNVDRYVRASMENDVRRALFDFIDDTTGSGDIAEKITADKTRVSVDTKEEQAFIELKKSIAEFEGKQDVADALQEVSEFIGKRIEEWQIKQAPESPFNTVVTVMRNGEMEYYQIHDKNVLKSIRQAFQGETHFAISFLSSIGNTFKALTTGMNPAYIFGTELPQDIFGAWVYDEYNVSPIRVMRESVTGIIHAIRNTPEYQDYLANGGGYQGSYTVKIGNLSRMYHLITNPKGKIRIDPKTVREMKNPMGSDLVEEAKTRLRQAKTAKEIAEAEKDKAKALFEREINRALACIDFLVDVIGGVINPAKEKIDHLFDAFDSGLRYAKYRGTREHGGNVRDAIRTAQEANGNFRARGFVSKGVDIAIPFTGAATSVHRSIISHAQGKGGRDNRSKAERKKFAKRFVGAVIVGSVALEMLPLIWEYFMTSLLSDDEKEKAKEAYENLSSYQKAAYYIFYIPGSDGEFFKIAKSKDLAFIGNVVGAALRAFYEDSPESFESTFQYILDGIMLPGMSTEISKEALYRETLGSIPIAGSLFDIARNEDYTGSPIVPIGYQYKNTSEQYDDNTSGFAKAVGKATNSSPMEIDYFIDSEMGVIGDAIQFITTDGLWKDGPLSVVEKFLSPVTQKYYADSVYSTDIVNKFYDQKEAYDTGRTNYKNGSGEYSDLYNAYKYGKLADLYSALNKIRKAEGNEDVARDYKMRMNDVIKSINEAGMTDIDKKVSDLAERLGLDSVSDIAPYVPILTDIDISKTQQNIPLLFDEVLMAYTISQAELTILYQDILSSGKVDTAMEKALKAARKEVIATTKARMARFVRDRMQ